MKIDRYNIPFCLWKEFEFEASHSLKSLPPEHQCSRFHGHSYRVHIHFKGLLVPAHDWLIDYGDVSLIVKPIIAKLDHQNLDDILPFETTAENLTVWLAEQIGESLGEREGLLKAVEVFETRTSSVKLEF